MLTSGDTRHSVLIPCLSRMWGLGALEKGASAPDGATLLKGTKGAARMQKLWQLLSNILFLLVLLHCLKPWKDHFSRADLLYGPICDTYSNLLCHLRCLPFDHRTDMESGTTACSRFSAWRWSQTTSVGCQGKAGRPVQHRHHDKVATTWE